MKKISKTLLCIACLAASSSSFAAANTAGVKNPSELSTRQKIETATVIVAAPTTFTTVNVTPTSGVQINPSNNDKIAHFETSGVSAGEQVCFSDITTTGALKTAFRLKIGSGTGKTSPSQDYNVSTTNCGNKGENVGLDVLSNGTALPAGTTTISTTVTTYTF